MKRRGKYIIHCASISYPWTGNEDLDPSNERKMFGGPIHLEGRGPTLKEVLSNELYVPPKQINVLMQTMNSQCMPDLPNDFSLENYFPEEYSITGIPKIKLYNLLKEKAMELGAWNEDWSSPQGGQCMSRLMMPFMWSGFKTLNFKKYLESRGFDVEILDYIDLVNMGINPSNHGTMVQQYHQSVLTTTEKNNLEYILIVSKSNSWLNGVEQNLYLGGNSQAQDGSDVYVDYHGIANWDIIQTITVDGADHPDDSSGNHTDLNYSDLGSDWEHEDCEEQAWYGYNCPLWGNIDSVALGFGDNIATDTQNFPENKFFLPVPVGRWNMQHFQEPDYMVMNTINYHTLEREFVCHNNPHCLVGISDMQRYYEQTPGYHYDNFLLTYGLPGGGGRGSLSRQLIDGEGIDWEEPNTTNREYLELYNSGTLTKRDYLTLLETIDEENSTRFEDEPRDDCRPGQHFDIITESCVENNGGDRAVVSPLNSSNWLARRLDDLGLNPIGPTNEPPYIQDVMSENTHVESHSGIFNYRGWAGCRGPSVPNMHWGSEWLPVSSGYAVSWPNMVFMGWVCDTVDFGANTYCQGTCFGDRLMKPYLGQYISQQFTNSLVNSIPVGFAAAIGLSELHSEAKFNNLIMAGFWRYMFGEVSEFFKAAYESIRFPLIKNQEIGHALVYGKLIMHNEFSWDPNLSDNHDGGYVYPQEGYKHYYESYNILGDPSLAFYIGKPKNIMVTGILDGQYVGDNFNMNVYGEHEANPLNEALIVAMYNEDNISGNIEILDENYTVVHTSNSDETGLVSFNLGGLGIPTGTQIEIYINIHQHLPKRVRVFYNGV